MARKPLTPAERAEAEAEMLAADLDAEDKIGQEWAAEGYPSVPRDEN